MRVVHELRRRSRQIAPQVLFACVFGYFAYHAVHGDRGILAWQRLEQELDRTKSVHATLAGERAALEHKVSLLRPEHLDPDLLDEQARRLLNYGRAEDLVIILRSDKAREAGSD